MTDVVTYGVGGYDPGQPSDNVVGQSTVPSGDRTPDARFVALSADSGSGEDFVGHLLSGRVLGDFTDTTSTNTGWVWGVNIYTHTGTASSDGAGIDYLTGALIEASVRSSGVTGAVIGLQAEAAFLGGSAGGTASNMTSLKVAQPKRKDGATAGNATRVYGLYVDAVPDGHLGSSEAYSVYVAGGQAYFAGDVFAGGGVTVPEGQVARVDGHDLYGKSVGKLGTDSGFHVGGDARVEGDATVVGSVLGGTFARVSNLNNKILWGSGSPEGVVAARQGSLYIRDDGGAGTTLYVKESGNGSSNTGWSAK